MKKVIVYLDDFETTLDLVVSAEFDKVDRVMDDILIKVRTDEGEVIANSLFTDEQMNDFKDMLFDEIYSGWEE